MQRNIQADKAGRWEVSKLGRPPIAPTREELQLQIENLRGCLRKMLLQVLTSETNVDSFVRDIQMQGMERLAKKGGVK
jgi:hypothetical protein